MKHQLCQGDCKLWLPQFCINRKFDTIFADPPDNIGLRYEASNDRMDDGEYANLLGEWISLFLQHANTVWLSFNAKWTPTVGYLAVEMDNIEVKPCVQTFTFGQHRQTDLGNNHRPLWRFSHPGAPLFPDNIRVESWRQKHGDKRADPRGKIPGDVFEFPRVTGNSKQRRKWHPTQLHEGLVERCLKLTTPAGGRVCDPFAGTGTTLRVAKSLGYNCTLIELSEHYCLHIADEHEMELREIGRLQRWELDT